MKKSKNLLYILCIAIAACGSPKEKQPAESAPADSSANAAAKSAAADTTELICNYCVPGDKHQSPERAAYLEIMAFKNHFQENIANIGGTLILRDIPDNPLTSDDKNLVEPWNVLKFHLCYDDGYLFLALDSAGRCEPITANEGRYQPSLSRMDKLIVSADDNYIPMSELGNDAETHLRNYNKLSTKTVKQMPMTEVIKYSKAFNGYPLLKNNYPCEFVYFAKAPTFDFIRSEIKTNTFRYYFGYNTSGDVKHKIRIYLFGVYETGDNKYQNYVTKPHDAGTTRIMQTSRPKP